HLPDQERIQKEIKDAETKAVGEIEAERKKIDDEIAAIQREMQGAQLELKLAEAEEEEKWRKSSSLTKDRSREFLRRDMGHGWQATFCTGMSARERVLTLNSVFAGSKWKDAPERYLLYSSSQECPILLQKTAKGTYDFLYEYLPCSFAEYEQAVKNL